jgi:hypothetical protein
MEQKTTRLHTAVAATTARQTDDITDWQAFASAPWFSALAETHSLYPVEDAAQAGLPKAARQRRTPKRFAQSVISVNGAEGISDIEGKVARVAMSDLGKSEFQIRGSPPLRPPRPHAVNHGFAKPISIGAPGFCVFTMTALSGRTSTSLYLTSSCGFSENSWSLRTSNSRRPPQV